MMYGYRAMAKLFFTYFNRGDNTLRKLIATYSPPNENNTEKYIYDVSQDSGISPNRILTKRDFTNGNVKKIIRSVSNQEISYVDESELSLGYNEFLKGI